LNPHHISLFHSNQRSRTTKLTVISPSEEDEERKEVEMASMAVNAATGVMNSPLSKLSTLLSDHPCKQLKGVRRDIELFFMTDMNAALKKLADMEKLDDGQKKAWRHYVCEMAYDIEDCIDIYMYHIGLRTRHQIADKVQELKARVVAESERRGRYETDDSKVTSTLRGGKKACGHRWSMRGNFAMVDGRWQ
jgi:hypothetical protein